MTDNGGGRVAGGDASWFKPSEDRHLKQSDYQDPLDDQEQQEETVFPDSGGYAGLSSSRPALADPYPEALGGPPVEPPNPLSYPGAGDAAYRPLTRIPGEEAAPGAREGAAAPQEPGALWTDVPGGGTDDVHERFDDSWDAEGAADHGRTAGRPQAPHGADTGPFGDRTAPGETGEAYGAAGWDAESGDGRAPAWSPEGSDPLGSRTPWDADGSDPLGSGSRPDRGHDASREEADPLGGDDRASAWNADDRTPAWSPDDPDPLGADARSDRTPSWESGSADPLGGDARPAWESEASGRPAAWDSDPLGGDTRPSWDSGDAGRSGGWDSGDSDPLGGDTRSDRGRDDRTPSWESGTADPLGGDIRPSWDSEASGRSSGWDSSDSDPLGGDTRAAWDSGDAGRSGAWEPGDSDPLGGDTRSTWESGTADPLGGDARPSWDSEGAGRSAAWDADGSDPLGGDTRSAWESGTADPLGGDTRPSWDSEASGRSSGWDSSDSDPLGGDTRAAWDSGDAGRSGAWEPGDSDPLGGDTRSTWEPGSADPLGGDTRPAWDSEASGRSAAWDSDPLGGDTRPSWDSESAGRSSAWDTSDSDPLGGGTRSTWGADDSDPLGGDTRPARDLDDRPDTPWGADPLAADGGRAGADVDPLTDGSYGVRGDDRGPSLGPDDDPLGDGRDAEQGSEPDPWGWSRDADAAPGPVRTPDSREERPSTPWTDVPEPDAWDESPGATGNTWAFDRNDPRLPDVVREAERRRREERGTETPQDPPAAIAEAQSRAAEADPGATQMIDPVEEDEAPAAADDPDYDDGFTPADYGMPVKPKAKKRRKDVIAEEFPGFEDRPLGGEAGDSYPGYDSVDFLADTDRGAVATLWLGIASLIPGFGLVTALLALLVTGPRAKRAIRGSNGTLDGLGFITGGTVFAVLGILVTVISVAIWLLP